MTAREEFDGFPSDTLAFLLLLRKQNTHAWFNAHRREYERHVLEPAKAFVAAAGRALRELAPDIRAEPRVLGSIFRQLKDTRYEQHERPYKDHLDFWFWEGERRQAVSGFFLRLNPDFVGIGGGCHGFDPLRLRLFRAAAANPHAGGKLEQIVAELRRREYIVSGERLKRIPKGFERATSALLRNSALYVHIDAPASLALDRSLVAACTRHWRALLPLHEWITTHVQRPPA